MMCPLIRSDLMCDKCGKVSRTYETCLSNFCPINNTIKSLSDLTAMIEKPVNIVDAVCSVCKNMGMLQTKKITRLPYVLIVTLQRFEQQMVTRRVPVYKKLHQYIEVPSILSLEGTSDPSLNVAIYNHTGSVLHYGANPRSGHYVANIPLNEKNYKTYNDSSVTNCKSEKALLEQSTDGYIHVYQGWDSLFSC
jgi:ubiquitin C-terminal hydrolase